VAGAAPSTTSTLERLAPGTLLRQGLERILQQDSGALIVVGAGPEVEEVSTGGFWLKRTSFTPARLAELAKMDGGIILDGDGEAIVAANVHFVPSHEIHTDETGARYRTAERVAIQTRVPVVAVSEGRKVATLFYAGQKIELASPTALRARVNQELQTLDRFRRRLDEAEVHLSRQEVAGLATYHDVVRVLQRAEVVRRIGLSIELEVVAQGEEGRLARVQLADLLRGVEQVREATLHDHLRPRRRSKIEGAIERLEALSDPGLDDPDQVGETLGFPGLDELALALGYRILASVPRLPEPVREELVRHFASVPRLMAASPSELERVEGVGEARAAQLRHFFDRLQSSAEEWAPGSV
jgi:diadenylate cyclase